MPCHGADGVGDGPVAKRLGLRPRDFTRGRFKLKTSVPDQMPFDEDLFRSLSVGFPDGAMPAFVDFTGEERWSLVDHVRSLAQRTTPEGRAISWFDAYPASTRAPEGDPAGRGRIDRGRELFRTIAQCSRCHGEQGRGDGPLAAELRDSDDQPQPLPDFAQGQLSFKGGAEGADIFRVLSTGMAGTAMPSFLALSRQDREDLARFVTSLLRPVRPGEGLFLLRGCIQCHTLGRGRRTGPDLAGVLARRPREWLARWLKDPPSMLALDEQARALARDFPVPMPNLNLTEFEVAALLDYLASIAPAAPR